MSNTTIFFLISAFALLVLIPILIKKDLKKGKKTKDIFLAHCLIFLLLLLCISEVIKGLIPVAQVHFLNQLLFLIVVILFGIPLLIILFMNIKKDSQKWNNPKNYNYLWLYKIRYIFFFFFIALLLGAVYKFYLIFIILFFQ